MDARPDAHHRGRPPIPPERRRRSQLLLRLTAAELDTIRRRAARSRLPTAAYARTAALRIGLPPGRVPVLNIRLVGELGRLANNLNQLTKLVHQGRTSPLLLPCLEAIPAEVRKLRRELIGLDRLSGPASNAEHDPRGGEDGGADPGA